MQKKVSVLLALASFGFNALSSDFADRVVSYEPGVGYVAGYTNAETVLGEPSRLNPFGESTDPFNPPYGKDQIVSIGAGGSLVVEFQTPILNHPHNVYGLDFTIFGNSGFIITNDFDLNTFEWIGTPATDGSLFAQNTGATRVSVSKDGDYFFTLASSTSRPVDYLFPADASGNFHIPVMPQVVQDDFAGTTLEEIRQVYAGSAGGTSFDISSAVDDYGRPVLLHQIRFIKIEVLSGKAEIDGFATVARNLK